MRQKELRRLFWVMGFSGVVKWDATKLREMAHLLPRRIKRHHIPRKYLSIYDELVRINTNREYIVWTTQKPKPLDLPAQHEGREDS